MPADVSIVDTTGHCWPASVVCCDDTPPEYRYVFCLSSNCLMADHNLEDTSRTTDSIEATGLIASSASLPGLANKFLSTDTSATAMARFSLELRDLEAAAALEALGMVPETQWPGTEASTLELSTDSEVTFRKVLGSAEVLATITWSGPAGSDQAFARLQSDHTVASSDQSVCHRTSWHAVSCCVPRVWSFDHPGWTRKPN